MEGEVRAQGATPATIGVVAGTPTVGMSGDDVERFAREQGILKLSRRDIAYAVAMRRHGATTVAATMALAALAGVQVFATGGIGGVHRGAETTWDVSADLTELARTPVVVVCAGAKAILDLPATLEYLRRGGRIGNASALVGSVLQVRPILTVADGETTVVKKVRTTKRAIEEIVALAEADLDAHGLVDLAVHHIDAEEQARAVAGVFAERLGRDVPLVPIGAVIGTHVGPGAVGVVYVTRERLGSVGAA
jgi:pseudouridine-5'-phosphate glycosidase